MSQWVNRAVSIECHDNNVYQGLVSHVDSATSAVTLRNIIKNGQPFEKTSISLLATQIKELNFVETTPSIQKFAAIQRVESGSEDKEKMKYKKEKKPVKVVRANASTKMEEKPEQHRHPSRRRSNSFTVSESPSNYGYNSPKRLEQMQKNSKQRHPPGGHADCFDVSVESCMGDFDFEKNLAMFDKQQVYDEIENGTKSRNTPKRADKYRHDEMIIKTKPTRQIKVLNEDSNGNFYTTDDGLAIPCISADMRERLFAQAAIAGYTEQMRIDMVGRNTSDMVFQLIGGSNRLNPQNNHQFPTIVIFCGQHVQGCYGLNCARHLANHNIKTIVYTPPIATPHSPIFSTELSLYDLCGAKRIERTDSLPTGAVDLIINCLDSTHAPQYSTEYWYRYITNWCDTSRAHVLAIDPMPSGCSINTKWSVHVGLPQLLPRSAGQTYLCDIGLPKKLFSYIGIKYQSPFGIKFCIPLQND